MKERRLEVYFGERLVGTMAQTADRRVAFAYSEEWLDSGFAISPFYLPVERKVLCRCAQIRPRDRGRESCAAPYADRRGDP